MSKEFAGKPFRSDAPVITTNCGLRVRSKSEKIMADYFDSKGVKYKYECPLELKPYGIIYPDFTFLSPKNGKEVYWEHEGMMDNPEYARTAVMKISSYEKNGIFPGEDLIIRQLVTEDAKAFSDMAKDGSLEEVGFSKDMQHKQQMLMCSTILIIMICRRLLLRLKTEMWHLGKLQKKQVLN